MATKYESLSERDEQVAKMIVDAAYTVHRQIGPGLLEKVYETCFCHELHKRNLKFATQVEVPIVYDGITFQEGFRLDVLVEDLIICELKAVEKLIPLHKAQLMTQLKLSKHRLGFLINFNVPLFKDGISRVIL